MSIWISIPVDCKELEKVKDPNLEDPLHITLAFLEESYLDQHIDTETRLKDILAGIAIGMYPTKITAEAPLVTYFNDTITILQINLPMNFLSMRNKLTDSLERLDLHSSTKYGFVPHVTLSFEKKKIDFPYTGFWAESIDLHNNGEITTWFF
jgi:2'-5' RNA ligase